MQETNLHFIFHVCNYDFFPETFLQCREGQEWLVYSEGQVLTFLQFSGSQSPLGEGSNLIPLSRCVSKNKCKIH
jgi:hypothetical protein